MGARTSRRTLGGGAKKRPTRYATGLATSPELALALRAHKKGMLAEAAQRYRQVVDREPDCLDAWMNEGTLAVTLGRGRLAETSFARATALAPGDARVRRDVGIGLSALGRFSQAIAAFERALSLDPSSLGARLGLARASANQGDRDAAIRHATRATHDAPLEASAHLELHRACFDDRDLGPCVHAAARAVAIDPDYALARYFLAGALGLSGRSDAAAAALGPEGLVAPGLRDVLAYVHAHEPPARAFATQRETLLFALAEAKSPGVIVELGVRHGVTTRVLAERALGVVHGFDSFLGLPEAWQGRTEGAFSTGGEVPDLPENVAIHVGQFRDTLPAFVRERGEPIRLLHVDSDLYSSARTALVTLAPLLAPGCVLVFDELIGNASWRGDEFRALEETKAERGWACETLALSWLTGQGVVRIAG